MKEFLVKASSLYATYTAGRYFAASSQDAIELARKDYADSALGKTLKDLNSFRFWVVSDQEQEEEN